MHIFRGLFGGTGSEAPRGRDCAAESVAELPTGAIFATASPDSLKLAYAVPVRGGAYVAVNGKGGQIYDSVAGLTFSENSRSLAYAALRGRQWSVVVDAKEYEPWDEIGVTSPVLSPDGEHVAYSCKGY
jgi:hypothetical protein